MAAPFIIIVKIIASMTGILSRLLITDRTNLGSIDVEKKEKNVMFKACVMVNSHLELYKW